MVKIFSLFLICFHIIWFDNRKKIISIIVTWLFFILAILMFNLSFIYIDDKYQQTSFFSLAKLANLIVVLFFTMLISIDHNITNLKERGLFAFTLVHGVNVSLFTFIHYLIHLFTISLPIIFFCWFFIVTNIEIQPDEIILNNLSPLQQLTIWVLIAPPLSAITILINYLLVGNKISMIIMGFIAMPLFMPLFILIISAFTANIPFLNIIFLLCAYLFFLFTQLLLFVPSMSKELI